MAIEISTAEELIAFSNGAHGRGTSDAYIDAVLTADIDFADYTEGYSWPGCTGTWYCNFDGKGHKVNNIYYSGVDAWGFFGTVNGSVKNLELTNLYAFSSDNAASGVADACYGTIENVTVLGNLTAGRHCSGIVRGGNATLRRCHFSGQLYSTGNRVGGLSAEYVYKVFECSVVADLMTDQLYKFALCNTNGGMYNSFFRGTMMGNAANYIPGDSGALTCYVAISKLSGTVYTYGTNVYYDSTLAAAGGFTIGLTPATTEELQDPEWLRAHHFAI